MTKIEFHQKRMQLMPGIITGIENITKLNRLHYEYDTSMGSDAVDVILDYYNESPGFIEYVKKELKFSKDFLNKAGVEIDIEPRWTRQEWVEYEAWQKQFCRDPLRWRVPGWIRIPISKLFKKHSAIKK